MNKLLAAAAVLSGFIVFLFFAAWATMWTSIPAGHVGVISNRGNIEGQTLVPGWEIVSPWKSVLQVNCQTQKDEEEATSPTKDGLSCTIKTVLLYHLDSTSAIEVCQKTGYADYAAKLVAPQFRAAIRDATVQFDSEALYTADRQKVESLISGKVTHALAANGIIVESVQLLDLAIPRIVKDRIEAKVGAAQDALRMEFVLKQKTLEGQAKVVEAKALAEAQIIIQKDLSDSYLKYLSIKALEKVAEGGNMVIYVNDGIPLMMGPPTAKKK